MKITIIGVGALGSHLVAALRNEGVELTIIDHDRVEIGNVASQFHLKSNVGKKKAESLRRAMQFCYGTSPPIIERVHMLVEDNADMLLHGAELLVDCLDNGKARRIVQAYARAHGVPCIHGGLAADGEFGRVVWDEHFIIDDEPAAAAPTCEDGAFLPFIQLTSAALALAVQAFVRRGQRIGFSISPGGMLRI